MIKRLWIIGILCIVPYIQGCFFFIIPLPSVSSAPPGYIARDISKENIKCPDNPKDDRISNERSQERSHQATVAPTTMETSGGCS